ncbi:MAG: DUF4390 domain-containing protein [Pseudomonadota bacterium]
MPLASFPHRAPRTALPLWVFGVLAWCFAASAWADEATITQAQTSLRNGIHVLEAKVKLQLGAELVEALQNGVMLPFKIHIEILRRREYVWDEEVAALTQRYSLQYHALSRQYILTNHNSGVVRNFRSLNSALDDLGRIKDLPLIDDSLLEKDARYLARMRVALSSSRLPIPLRLRTYVYSEWDVGSEWYEWFL